jgi:hypothetical protein
MIGGHNFVETSGSLHFGQSSFSGSGLVVNLFEVKISYFAAKGSQPACNDNYNCKCFHLSPLTLALSLVVLIVEPIPKHAFANRNLQRRRRGIFVASPSQSILSPVGAAYSPHLADYAAPDGAGNYFCPDYYKDFAPTALNSVPVGDGNEPA